MLEALGTEVSPGVWAAIGGAATVVALLTALINHRTAQVGWRQARVAAGIGEVALQPKMQLPGRPQFINREDAMRQAVSLIRSGEMVVAIEGEVGVGKSAVARELAYRLSAEELEDNAPPALRRDTYLWIDGRNGCPRLVDICASLSLLTGDQALSTVPEDGKLAALRAHLAGNKTLLVFDNLRLKDDPESESIRELLRTVPTGTLVIASVNRRGELDAAPVTLDDLHPPHVRDFIQQETRRLELGNGATFDAAFAERLQNAVGGNPGRIGWFLRALRGSARSVDERLAAVERGEGLSTLFAPVWEELTEEAKTVLAGCAYLRGQAILEQLVIACDLEEDRVSSLLEELLEVGLVLTVRVTGRPNVFACPHGVQRFVRFETREDANAVFTQRLTDHYIGYFAANREDARAAIPHVGALQAVHEELFAHGNDGGLQALFGATNDLLFSLGQFDARIALGTLAYQSAERADNHRCASLASEVLSSTHVVRGEFEHAREALALGVLAAERSGDPGEIARQMRCSGFLRYRMGQPEQALMAVETADRLAREGNEPYTLVNILNLRCYAHWYLRALDESEAAAQGSLRVCEEISWQRAKAFPIRQLAEIATHRGEFGRARELLDRARSIAVEADDMRHLARIYVAEARLGLISGDLDGARVAATQGESEAIRLGLRPEAREARALGVAARRARVLLPIRWYYARRRPTRLTNAPVL